VPFSDLAMGILLQDFNIKISFATCIKELSFNRLPVIIQAQPLLWMHFGMVLLKIALLTSLATSMLIIMVT